MHDRFHADRVVERGTVLDLYDTFPLRPGFKDLACEQLVNPGMEKACIPSIFIKTSHFFWRKLTSIIIF